MQIHSLDFEDFSEDNYSLIGIHTVLEDYKLAYLLNKHLNTTFTRASYSLDFEKEKNNASFSIYNYSNSTYDFEWFLLANSSIVENKSQSEGLFSSSETKNYLIPEKRKVDFFIKIIGDSDAEFILKAVEKIKKVDQVITSYSIEPQTLKSKDFLIF
jgi:hypothetical protein